MHNLNDADDLAAMDLAHAIHPFHHLGAAPERLILARGEGVHLWDVRGRRYLDAVAGLWCTNIGLGRREMAEAIARQAERLAFSATFVTMNNDVAVRLAGRVAELAPGDLKHVHFTTGGSTAIDSAFRMVAFAQTCLGHPKKRHVIARRHSYHGSTFAAMSLGMRTGDQPPEFVYERRLVHHVGAPYQYRPPPGVTAETLTDHLVAEFEATIDRIGADKVGGFFAEPIQASGGILVPPDDYLRRMKAVCERHGILFIADEVVTAWGRLGHWFASLDEFGVQPDMICTAKGLTSAYQPLGALLVSDRLFRALESEDRWLTNGFTYSGHPVACAAALTNIEIIEREGLRENAARVGKRLGQRLAELAALPLVGDVRGRGLMWCVECVADKATRTALPDAANVAGRIASACAAREVIVRPLGPLVILSPALILTEAQADHIAGVLGEAIREVADGLVRDGYKVT
jgi:putrescine aminotransferase